MANYWALSAGNWSNVSNWLTGTSPGQMAGALPGPEDDVYANNRIVTVDITTQVNSVRNIANSVSNRDGGFILSDGITLSALVIGRTIVPFCIQYYGVDSAQATIVGNLCAINISAVGNTGGQSQAVVAENNDTGTLNIFGDIIASFNNGAQMGFGFPWEYGSVVNRGNGTINVFGNVINDNYPEHVTLANLSEGTINIVGNLSGYNAGFASGYAGVRGGFAVSNAGTGTVNITGNIHSRTLGGLSQWGEGVVNIIGDIDNSGGVRISNVVNAQGGNLNLQGNIYVSRTPLDSYYYHAGIQNLGIGTIGMSGNVFMQGGANNFGILNQGSGAVYLTGSVFAGPLSNSIGIANLANTVQNIAGRDSSTGNGAIFVFGSVHGGQGANSHGLSNQDGLAFVFENAYGGQGAGGNGAINTRFGTINVRTAVGNNWGIGSVTETGPVPGVVNTSILGACYIEELSSASRGTFPVSGPNIYINRRANNQASFVGATSANSTTIQSPSILTLISSLSGFGALVPLVSNVRLGAVYDLKSLTGTLIIPPTQVVLSGTPVDTLTSLGTFFTDLPRAWQTQMSAITAQDSLGVRFKNIITLPEAENVWLLDT